MKGHFPSPSGWEAVRLKVDQLPGASSYQERGGGLCVHAFDAFPGPSLHLGVILMMDEML